MSHPVRRYGAEVSEEWISWDTASQLTGIPVPTIEHAVRVGRIERRPRQGRRPSLRYDSVLTWAERHQSRLEERAARRVRKRRDRAVRFGHRRAG